MCITLTARVALTSLWSWKIEVDRGVKVAMQIPRECVIDVARADDAVIDQTAGKFEYFGLGSVGFLPNLEPNFSWKAHKAIEAGLSRHLIACKCNCRIVVDV